MPTINLQEIDKPASVAAAVLVVLQGFKSGETIALDFWEDDLDDSLMPSTGRTAQKIGTVEGEVALLDASPGRAPLFTLKPSKTTTITKSTLKLLVVFKQPGGSGSSATAQAELFLPNEKIDVFEGDSWEVWAAEKTQAVQSPITRLARVRRALSVQKGEATYSHYVGHQCRFYGDGSTNSTSSGGYFHDLKIAINEAKDFIYIADWSFHPHMRLEHSGTYDLDTTIGHLLIDKALKNKDLVIAIHTWDHTVVLGHGAPDPQNDDGGAELDRIAQEAFGKARRPANLLWRASSRTGTGFSHHQKFVVMDANMDGQPDRRRLRAFIGGLDLTKGRVDFSQHPIMPADPVAASHEQLLVYIQAGPREYDDWYNAEFFSLGPVVIRPTLPRQPWHDVALHFVGPACWDLVREFTGRWRLDPSILGASGNKDAASIKVVMDKYIDLLQRPKDPSKPHDFRSNPRVYSQQWDGAGGPWSIQVLRSLFRDHWEAKPPVTIKMPDRTRQEFKWTHNGDSELSIQRSYIQAIQQAENYIYIETQYFISSGSLWGRPTVGNPLALNLALRAINQAKKGLPFHIYLIVPMFPEGDPGLGSNCAQRQFQWATIRSMALMIESQSGRKAEELMSVFFLANWTDLGGTLPNVMGGREANVRGNQRYQIYVHSKFMMVDDRFMIIGSANLNERSLNGARDSEIAVSLWPSDDSTAQACVNDAKALRRQLWTEHLGPKFPPADFDKPESPACFNAVRAAAEENYAAFREGRRDPAVHGHLCLWPLAPVADALPIRTATKAPELDGMIPDRPFGLSGRDLDAWRWHAPGSWTELAVSCTDPGKDTAE